MAKESKKLSFEEAMQALEDTAQAMESGEMTLEESLAAYEKAVQLIAECRQTLEACQERITVLKKDSLGRIREEDFTPRER